MITCLTLLPFKPKSCNTTILMLTIFNVQVRPDLLLFIDVLFLNFEPKNANKNAVCLCKIFIFLMNQYTLTLRRCCTKGYLLINIDRKETF